MLCASPEVVRSGTLQVKRLSMDGRPYCSRQFVCGGVRVEVKNTFLNTIDDTAPRPEELLRAQSAPSQICIGECGYEDAPALQGRRPPSNSSSSSTAADDLLDRIDDFDDAVRSPAPERKFSEEEAAGCGRLLEAIEDPDDLAHWHLPEEACAERGRNETFSAPCVSPAKAEVNAAASHLVSPASMPHAVATATSVPQPQTLSMQYASESQKYQVTWTVDARKLKGNDKQAVSPPFDIVFGTNRVTFKMMIYPKAHDESKGGASFKKSRGQGFIQLKCEGDLSAGGEAVTFWLSIGSQTLRESDRGPAQHNFVHSAVCGLPRTHEEWDFLKVVDHNSMTFNVYLTVMPQILGSACSGRGHAR